MTPTTAAAAPETTAPPVLPPVAAGYARITLSNSYSRSVRVRLEDGEVVVADLEPGAATEPFEIATATDHADSGRVAPIDEAGCGSSGVGENFASGHTYAVTVLDWDGTGEVEGGRCGDGTMPALQVRDLTCSGSAPYWMGRRVGPASVAQVPTSTPTTRAPSATTTTAPRAVAPCGLSGTG